MNCEILETLYVRSNGDIPCNDDAGENVLLGLIRPQLRKWSPDSLFGNRSFRHIRESLARGQEPWPGVCQRCAFFRPHVPFSDAISQRRIRKLQVEPSLACHLRCPSCSNQFQKRTRPPPLQMDLGLFEEMLRSLRGEAYSIGEIEYCGQGEPLLHPLFAEFVACASESFPEAHQRLITSGNFSYSSTAGRADLDEVIVSCDGIFPDSYSRYRKGGSVDRPIQFLRDARESAPFPALLVIWKYILFEWNDSEEELVAAQRLADELHLDWLLFVFTHSAGKSRRHTLEDPSSLPVLGTRVITNATPVHYQVVPPS